MDQIQNYWRKCSTCKKEIGFNAKYYECSVSTCTGQRTGYVFCSVGCWEVHLPGAKHRDAGAVEKQSPAAVQSGDVTASRRIIIASAVSAPLVSQKKSSMSAEVLVVVSKMKQYIREMSEMNVSDDVSQILSDTIRVECDRAIEKARSAGRKTVMARDFR